MASHPRVGADINKQMAELHRLMRRYRTIYDAWKAAGYPADLCLLIEQYETMINVAWGKLCVSVHRNGLSLRGATEPLATRERRCQ